MMRVGPVCERGGREGGREGGRMSILVKGMERGGGDIPKLKQLCDGGAGCVKERSRA
jgi:hypothetical protein